MYVIVVVILAVVDGVIVAALGNGNDAVGVIVDVTVNPATIRSTISFPFPSAATSTGSISITPTSTSTGRCDES